MEYRDSDDRFTWPSVWPRDSFSPWSTLRFTLLLPVLGVFAGVVSWFGLYVWANSTSNVGAVNAMAGAAAKGLYVTVGGYFVNLAGTSVMQAAMATVILFALPGLAQFSLWDLGFRPLNVRAIGHALVGAVVMLAIVHSLWVGNFGGIASEPVARVLGRIHNSGFLLGILLLLLVVVGPVSEEIVFRVFLFNLGLRYGGFWLGAIISSALFGLMHFIGGATSARGALLLGIGAVPLCWVYFHSKNAYASMISHSLYNAVTLMAYGFAVWPR